MTLIPAINPGTGNRCEHQNARGADLYETAPEVVRALARTVDLPRDIFEPCAGRGAIKDELESLGHRVLATDLHDYGRDDIESGLDFIFSAPLMRPMTIVSNPPFNMASEFIERGLEVADTSYWLLRMQFVHRVTDRDLMASLAAVYPLAPRIPRMHRDGWEGPVGPPTDNFAWYCFDRRKKWNQPTTLRVIYWKDGT